MQVKKYFEKKVSLLSTSDVRYDGELYTVDPSEQSIALKHVNCMGTEGRRTGDQAIAPSDCTYEFIIFRAVNIRELWLDEGNGRRRDLTDEILIPLRSGQSANYPPKQRQDVYDQQDVGPKRKVGYQSRSQQQQQQSYDRYYQQQGSGGYGRGQQQSSRSYYSGRGGYGPPPQSFDQQDAYPPLPTQNQQYYQQYNAPQTYYDTPNQGYYPSNQGGYRQSGYRQRQSGYPQQSGYQQRGYQRQRQPQYYNQQRQGYYNQNYVQQNQYYNQQRRYPQQYNRGYQQNQRGYQRNYNQRNRNRTGGDKNGGQAGTGAFLDNRRLRGDEIEFKDQQDFDFGAAKDQFTQNGVADAVQSEVVQNGVKEKVEETDKGDDDKKNVVVAADDDEEETKEDDENKKYDKSKSFFDGLQTETKKSKPKQDMQTQKDVDSETFGSVAATYKSRHINRQNQGRYNGQRNYGQNRRYNQNRQRSNQQYNRPQNQQYQQRQQNNSYSTNKWVVRR